MCRGAHVCVHKRVHVYVQKHVDVCTCMYMYVYIHVHAHVTATCPCRRRKNYFGEINLSFAISLRQNSVSATYFVSEETLFADSKSTLASLMQICF